MASSWNVEEIALIVNWSKENAQSWSVALIYCSNSYCLLCVAQSIKDKVWHLYISYIYTSIPFMVSLQHNKATVVFLLFSFAEFCTIDSHHLFIFFILTFRWVIHEEQ